MAVSCISLQSSKRSFRKIQIFKLAYSALPLFYSLFRLSNSGIGPLWQWHWICSFQYMIIHFVSFRFVSQNTVSRIFDEEKFSAWFQTTTNPPWNGDKLSCLGIHVSWAWNRGTLGRNGTACISVESQYPTVTSEDVCMLYHTKRQVKYTIRNLIVMFVIAVCFFFLLRKKNRRISLLDDYY